MSPMTKRETVLVLQGGGALGAYECGVYRALEEQGILPDLVAGVSIGAVNAAIIAGNPRGRAARALEAFWNEVAVPDPPIPDGELRRFITAWQIAWFGVPKFFTPRWLTPSWLALLPFSWWSSTSLYDPTPLRNTLKRYVDFERLGAREIRLILTAVNVETGELEVFDSAEQPLTVEHVLASGSFFPGFPWTAIDGKRYWDGGLVANTPLGPVIEKRAGVPMNVYLVDLFAKARPLPTNLAGVLARRKDILYSDKTDCDLKSCELQNETLALIEELMEQADPEAAERIRRSRRYQRLTEQGCRLAITRFVHKGERLESDSKDYDFSREIVQGHIRHGYEQALAILAREIPATDSGKAGR